MGESAKDSGSGDTATALTRVSGRAGPAPAMRCMWPGTARYEVVRLLGEGGMGMVYQAIDRDAERSIAVKTLLQTNPASVFRFKQEFRTLADVQHPNLVQLHEFVATEAGEVFFTMELVHGTNFVRYVRDDQGHVDYQRLRQALTQLVEGVCALHAAGKLHRDIKPSNILVTTEGRVVILDFGVAAELSTSSGPSSEAEVVGTARFMAPEQALMAAPHPAFDWYSVGVVLYYVLTGSFPFSGSPEEIVEQKKSAEPVPPGKRAPDVPPDLEALCMSLLARVPGQRPTGAEILRHLGASQGALSRAHKPVNALVGREAHLRFLREAAHAKGSGGQRAVFVGGLSGMGKSALIRKFLDEQVEQHDALVLRGRAYERESLPFKAVDAVVDALSAHMKRAAKRNAPLPLPDDIALVAQVFPVLGRVPGVSSAFKEVALEPTLVRRRAFVALRELLASAAADRELIIQIDDAQWGDADSAALLLELLRPPTVARLLLITCYRQNEAGGSAFLGELRARLPKNVDSRELEVGPLALDDAERLAFELLGAEQHMESAARSVAHESGGCPFLIEELASSFVLDSHVEVTGGIADLSNVTLERMVSERSLRLPEGARRMLEIIAIEGRPVPVTLAAAAAHTQERAEENIRLLCSHRFVRAGLRDGREIVEMSHDRIRETVAAQISAALTRAHHAELARVFEATADENPEPMVVHLFGAGEKSRGSRFAEVAADQALAKLAFDRAAQLFRLANDTVSASCADGRRLRLRLAQALEWAGRGTEAAHIYEEVAKVAPSEERTALERAAAEHLLTCGRIDEGAAVLRRVLSAVGLSAPRNAVSAVAWLLAYRLWLRVRGLGFRGRAAAELKQADRLRLDALFTVSLGFGSVDVILSACMTARYLLASLSVGERSAITRAASLQMSLRSAEGGVEGKQEIALERTARHLVDQDPSPEAVAFFRSNIGISHYCRGRWSAAVRELDSVLHEFPAHRAGMTSNVKVFLVCSLVYEGRIRELRRMLPRLITEAEDRGDLFMLAHMGASHPVVAWLAADDVDDARRHARDGMARWPRLRFVIQHWQAMLAQAQIDLYAGEGGSAYDRIVRDLPDLRLSLLLQAQIIRGLTFFVHGRAAVASIASNPALREARLEEATRLARRLGRERMEWTSLLSALLYAAIANARGDADAAVASLRAAIDTAERAEMSMHGAAAMRQLGLLLGGDEGARYIAEADAAMEAEDIRAPERWATMLVPGRWKAA